jgi:type II restriction/modification system DNA methylase subunit YeeA
VTSFTAYDFIAKWKPVALTERATAQEHFLDLCRLFGHPTPAEDDPLGERFAFEKGVSKTGGGDGFADVWKRGFFAWEYKKKKRDLGKALEQLTRYAAALENPPLHVACDTHIFRIETRWTNEVPKAYEFELEDLAEPRHFETLRRVFFEPDKLKSGRDRQALTRDAADKFQAVSDSLQKRVAERETVAHFVNQLVFCFFAQSVALLPPGLMRKLLQLAENKPHKSREFFKNLFDGMAKGGEVGFDELVEFNGGLFDGRDALGLQHNEIAILFQVSNLDWSLIDPTIFGTLFERFLDPDKRAQIGAHYTEIDKIKLIVEPVIERPLQREWAAAKAHIEAMLAPFAEEANPSPARAKKREATWLAAAAARDAFIERLASLRILDPACGSGNFLYLALQAVKDIEYKAILDSEALGLPRVAPRVGPEILHGIEINPFAAELARTTIWIGDIQWRVKNAVLTHPRPILRKLDSIECRDALLTAEGAEAEWPEADFIVGNPPFLGGKLMRRGLGDTYVETLFTAFAGKVPAEADLVCYWFSKAWRALEAGRALRCGLVATNSIRGGANRRVLEPMAEKGAIFEAWSDEAWTVEGAAVRVSIVCFGGANASETYLDGLPVSGVFADLTSSIDLTKVKKLRENEGVCIEGFKKYGPFDVSGGVARDWLTAPLNVNSRPNSDVIRPWLNAMDLVRTSSDTWVVDFNGFSEDEAKLYEAPFEFAYEKVRPTRLKDRAKRTREKWWTFERDRPPLRRRLRQMSRFIATPVVSKHRLFVWLDPDCLIANLLDAIARDDDTTFGVLHSRFHEAWSLRLGTWLGVGNDPRYTPTTTFETYPFPEGLTPNLPAESYAADPRAQKIAAAAKRLDELRRAWLNPADLVDVLPEVTPTAAPGEPPRRYPDRIVPTTAEAAQKLKSRTLTNLYNERPRWLADAHQALDRAVAAAYGWPQDIETEDALTRLLALNGERAAKG